MICVSIGRSRHKHLIAEHKALVERGARLVEMRIDYVSSRVNLQRLLKDRPCPVIVTVRREADGGKFTGDEEQRQRLLREAIAEGVEYVDLEEDVAGKVPRYGKTKRIISHHNFRNTPADLPALHKRLAALDADVVKIATMAQHPRDNVRMLELVRDADSPTVGMCMGDIGTPSRVLCARVGAPFTYATFHHERALAPGQLSFQQMTDIYRYDTLTPGTAVYGVVADPVAHSLSPHLHNAAFAAAGVDAVYCPFRVPADDLAEFVRDLPRLGVRGLSVTIPHKEAISGHCTKGTGEAIGIGAVNTVLLRDGEVIGCNTDAQAAMNALEHALGAAAGTPPEQSPLRGQRVLVLGSGGVARAIVYGLGKRGARVVIASRTRGRSQALAEEFGARSVEWGARHGGDFDVLVNGTPIGMHPDVDESPFGRSHLRPGALVFDTVYNPEQTLLIKEARDHGCRVVTGVEMFIRQASLQFQLFTGKAAPADVMRETLKRVIGPVKY